MLLDPERSGPIRLWVANSMNTTKALKTVQKGAKWCMDPAGGGEKGRRNVSGAASGAAKTHAIGQDADVASR
jgi:hypothetical protein